MSVINQMLRDLDARHASEQERAGLPPGLRTLPPKQIARGGDWRTLVVGMLAGAALTGLAASWYFSSNAMPPATAVPSPPAAPAPRTAMPPAVPPAPSSAPTAVEGAPANPGGSEAVDMKLSTLLTNAQPEPVPAAPTPATPLVVPPAPAKETPSPAVKPAVPPKPTAPPKPPAAPQSEARAAAPVGKPAAEPPKPAPERTKAPQEQAKPTALPREAKLAAAAAAADAAGPDAQIDKRAKGGQAHEMADGEYRKGMQAVKRGDSGSAMTAFRHALELDPGFAKARQALLSVLVGGRQWSEARQTAQDGLALDPTQSGWATILARLQFEQNDVAAAIGTLERYASHAGGDADYQGLFAYLLQKQQRPAEAAQRFRSALALRPGEGRWWFGLGLSLESAGQVGEAKEAYARAKEVGSLPADMLSVVEQKLK
jgi:MSHA biogenesis protein MshN